MAKPEDRKPCAECPFAWTCTPGGIGGSEPEVYVGQAWGPFLLSCHMPADYWKDRWAPDNLQCSGAAIFRANVGRDALMPAGMLRLPADHALAFPDAAYLIAHHRGVSLEEARRSLALVPPHVLMRWELSKPEVVQYPKGSVRDGKRKSPEGDQA